MKCPCCGGAELVRDTRDVPYTYKGETTTVPAMTGDFCSACGEVILDRENGDRFMREMRAFTKQADGTASQREAREYDEFLRRKVEAGRASMRAGLGRPNDEVEAEFAALRPQR